MPSLLSSLVVNLSEINNKKPENEFTDNIRSMATSLSHSVDNLPEIDKKNRKIRKKKSIDSFRSMSSSLSHSVDNLSEINKKK